MFRVYQANPFQNYSLWLSNNRIPALRSGTLHVILLCDFKNVKKLHCARAAAEWRQGTGFDKQSLQPLLQ